LHEANRTRKQKRSHGIKGKEGVQDNEQRNVEALWNWRAEAQALDGAEPFLSNIKGGGQTKQNKKEALNWVGGGKRGGNGWGKNRRWVQEPV